MKHISKAFHIIRSLTLAGSTTEQTDTGLFFKMSDDGWVGVYIFAKLDADWV